MAEILQRVHQADLEVRADSIERIVHGIACPFNEEATVSDGGRPYRESFVRGAFARTILEHGPKVKFLAQHSRQTLPIGKASLLREDANGLNGEFKISKTRAGDEVLELVRDGALDGLSIGFSPIGHTWSPDRRSVVRHEVGLREVSAVSFPAYAGALVGGVRSQAGPYLEWAQHWLALHQRSIT